MRFIVTVHERETIAKLQDEIILLGNSSFAMCLTNSFSLAEIELVSNNHDVIFNANKIMSTDEVDNFSKYINNCNAPYLGVLVSDLGALNVLLNSKYANKAIYFPSAQITSTLDVEAVAGLDIMGTFLSKELSLADLQTIIRNKPTNINLFYQIHGYLPLMHAKRKLLSLQVKEPFDVLHYVIEEQTRFKKHHRIIEDDAGFHFFTDRVFLGYFYMDKLAGVDYFLIDSIFFDDNYLLYILNIYKTNESDTLTSFSKQYRVGYTLGNLLEKTEY
jgi:hypothetical protein